MSKDYYHKVLENFKNSQFVAHINFLWHWKNFFFLLKYPFYKVYNRWTGKFCGWDFSEYSCIPEGWRKAFGKQMSEELKKVIKAEKKRIWKEQHKIVTCRQLLVWEDIKEKYGSLRLYASATDAIDHVLRKYELMSEGYCIRCGKPARYCTKGWITYYCEDCMQWEANLTYTDNEGKNKYIYDEDFRKEGYKELRLTENDVPTMTRYVDGDRILIDIKSEYGIDFEELWGLKE